jgi:hypothetical protein
MAVSSSCSTLLNWLRAFISMEIHARVTSLCPHSTQSCTFDCVPMPHLRQGFGSTAPRRSWTRCCLQCSNIHSLPQRVASPIHNHLQRLRARFLLTSRFLNMFGIPRSMLSVMSHYIIRCINLKLIIIYCQCRHPSKSSAPIHDTDAR